MRIRDPFDSLRGIRSPFGNRRASAPPVPALDADAADYISRVEAADSATLGTPVTLEPAVVTAIDTFFKGLKADGVFAALKASCILAGARTVNGIIEPLKSDMETVTNVGFGQANFDRKKGIKGDGSTKYLNTNRANTADFKNNRHLSVFASTVGTGPVAGVDTNNTNRSLIYDTFTRHVNEGTQSYTMLAGFVGISRSVSFEYIRRNGGTNFAVNSPSSDLLLAVDDYTIFSDFGSDFGDHRVSFYSIGESLDLAALDARVSQLMTDLDGAIA